MIIMVLDKRKKSCKKIDSKGFTLAEVLITLAIIGVVAALTIPVVVQNYQKTQMVTQLKKTYSAIANTTNLAIADNGPISGWEVGPNNMAQSAIDFADKYFIPYLKVSKNCKTQTTDDCAFDYTYLNSTTKQSLGNTYTRFYLNDGTLVGSRISNTTTEEGKNYRQVYVYIDTNGQKKPNKLGKDIFLFKYYVFHESDSNYYTGKFLPYAYNNQRDLLVGNTEHPEACYKNGNGTLCAALILRDGWQIKDDYPWN